MSFTQALFSCSFTLGQEMHKIYLGPNPDWLHIATDVWSPPTLQSLALFWFGPTESQ